MASKDRFVSLAHPSLWPAWIGVGILRLLCQLPWSAQMRLGRAAGRFAYHVVRVRRKIVEVNLRLCFPEKSEAERRALAVAHYEAMGMGIFETCNAWWSPISRLPAMKIEGREHLEAASGKGKGVLLLTAHFTTLEICGRFFCEQIRMGGLYRDPDNRVIALQMQRSREGKLVPAVQMEDIRGLLRALRAGHTIWYAPDQGKKGKFAAVLPFFGVPALTNTATSRIAAMSGAAVVPYFGRRLADGTYLLTILPELGDFPGSEVKEDAIRTNKVMEDFIREAPEQYFWMHRRFKRRGRNLPDVYR